MSIDCLYGLRLPHVESPHNSLSAYSAEFASVAEITKEAFQGFFASHSSGVELIPSIFRHRHHHHLIGVVLTFDIGKTPT